MYDYNAYISDPSAFFELYDVSGINSPESVGFISKRRFYLSKVCGIKAVCRQLTKNKSFKRFDVRFLFSFKRKAFMRDDGKIFLSFGLVHKTKTVRLIAVLWHELAHIYLSQRPFYDELKQFNKLFLQKCKSNIANLLSPLELCAMDLSIKVLKKTFENENCAEIAEVICEEERKFDVLLEKLALLKTE